MCGIFAYVGKKRDCEVIFYWFRLDFFNKYIRIKSSKSLNLETFVISTGLDE